MLISHYSVLETSFFFFNDTATTEIYTLSLHDALPILIRQSGKFLTSQSVVVVERTCGCTGNGKIRPAIDLHRSEEHTSELQSHVNLVCRLLLEKKKDTIIKVYYEYNTVISTQ